MKILAVIISVSCCLVAAVVVVSYTDTSDTQQASGAMTGMRHFVKGDHNTLASIAKEIGDPEIFSYNPETRTALCTTSLIIEGKLQIGDPSNRAFKETLELDTDLCGDLQLDVRPGAELAVYNSSVSTASRIITLGSCTQGYMLRVSGKLLLDHATFQYASGSLPESGIRSSAVVKMTESSFTECDGSALRIIEVDGSDVSIDRCNFSSRGDWGVVAAGRGGEPVVIRNSVLDAQFGVVHISGGEAAVRLIDCDFDKSKIRFTRPSGRVEVAWTVNVTVEPPPDGGSVEGLRVVATSAEDCGMKEEVTGVTDKAGVAKLVLTEWVATPQSAIASAGKNNRTPHLIKVYGTGNAPIAVHSDPVRVGGKGLEVRVALSTKHARDADEGTSLLASRP